MSIDSQRLHIFLYLVLVLTVFRSTGIQLIAISYNIYVTGENISMYKRIVAKNYLYIHASFICCCAISVLLPAVLRPFYVYIVLNYFEKRLGREEKSAIQCISHM